MKLFGKKTQELNKGEVVEDRKTFKDKYMNEVDPSQVQEAPVAEPVEPAAVAEAAPAVETPVTPEAPVEPTPAEEVVPDPSTPVVPVEPALADTEIKPVFDTPQTKEDNSKLIDKFTNVVDPNEVQEEQNPSIIDKYMDEVDPASLETTPVSEAAPVEEAIPEITPVVEPMPAEAESTPAETPAEETSEDVPAEPAEEIAPVEVSEPVEEPKMAEAPKEEEPSIEAIPVHNSQLDDTLINLEPIGEEEPVNESAKIKGNKYNEIFGLNKEDFNKKREEYEKSPKKDEDFERIFGMKKEEADRLTDEYKKAHESELKDDKLDEKDEEIFNKLEEKEDEAPKEETSEDNPFDSMIKLDSKDKTFFKKFEDMGDRIDEELKSAPVEEKEEDVEVKKESEDEAPKEEEKEEKVEKVVKVFTKEDALKSLEKIRKELDENEDFLVSKEQAEEKIDALDEKIKETNDKMKDLENYIEFSEEEQGEVDLIKEQHDELEKSKKASETAIRTYERLRGLDEESLEKYEAIIESSETIIPELVGFEYLDSARKKEIVEMLDIPSKDKERYLKELDTLSFKNVDGMDITKDLILRAKTDGRAAMSEVEPLRKSVEEKNELIKEERTNIDRIEGEIRDNALELEELVERTNSEDVLESRRQQDEEIVNSFKEEKKFYERIVKMNNYSPIESLEKIVKDYENDLIDNEELSVNLDTLKTHIKTITDNDEKERIADRVATLEEEIKLLDEKIKDDKNYFVDVDPEELRMRIKKINDREMFARDKLDDLNKEYDKKNKELLGVNPGEEDLSSEAFMIKQKEIKAQLDYIKHQIAMTNMRIDQYKKARELVKDKTTEPVKGANKQADIRKKEQLMSELSALKTFDDSKENKRVIRMIERLQKKLKAEEKEEEIVPVKAKEEKDDKDVVIAPIPLVDGESISEDDNPLDRFVEDAEEEDEDKRRAVPVTFRENSKIGGLLSSLRSKISKKVVIAGSIVAAAVITAIVLYNLKHGQADNVDEVINNSVETIKQQIGLSDGMNTASPDDSFVNGDYDYSSGYTDDGYTSSTGAESSHSGGGTIHEGVDVTTEEPDLDVPGEEDVEPEVPEDIPEDESIEPEIPEDVPGDDVPTDEPEVPTEDNPEITLEPTDPGVDNPEVGGDAPLDIETNAPTPIGEGYGDGTYWVDANGNIFTLGEDGIPSADDVYSGHLDWSKFDKIVNEDGTVSFQVKDGVTGIDPDNLNLKDVMDGNVDTNNVVDNNVTDNSTVDETSTTEETEVVETTEETVEDVPTDEEVVVEDTTEETLDQPAQLFEDNTTPTEVQAESTTNDVSEPKVEASSVESTPAEPAHVETESAPAEPASAPSESAPANDVEKTVDSVVDEVSNNDVVEDFDSVKSR